MHRAICCHITPHLFLARHGSAGSREPAGPIDAEGEIGPLKFPVLVYMEFDKEIGLLRGAGKLAYLPLRVWHRY